MPTVRLRLSDTQTIELEQVDATALAANLIASGDGTESISAAATILMGLFHQIASPLSFSEAELSKVRDALVQDLDQ